MMNLGSLAPCLLGSMSPWLFGSLAPTLPGSLAPPLLRAVTPSLRCSVSTSRLGCTFRSWIPLRLRCTYDKHIMASTVGEIRDPVTMPSHHLQEHEEAEEALPSLASEGLPLLLPSLVIEGLPPLHHCVYMAEAEKVVMDYIRRWQIPSMESYIRLGLSFAGFMHSGVIDVDRLVAIAIAYGIAFLMDDLIFDSPNNVLLDQYGINATICGNPEQIKEYLHKVWNEVFAQKALPSQNPVEVILSKVGHDILRLSNPEWFCTLVAAIEEWFQASIDSHADIVYGESLCVQDLETYSAMRAGNCGGGFVLLLQEFALDTYLSEETRSLPFMVDARTDCILQTAFVNDIYSYHKESMVEANPRNVVTVLMETQEKTFVQGVHAAIELANLHAWKIIDLEMKTSDVTIRRHLQSLKVLMVGNIYYSSENRRYRHPESVFPELRDVNCASMN